MSDEAATQPLQETEQVQDQQAEQAATDAFAVIAHRLDDRTVKETKCAALLVRMALKLGLHAGLGFDATSETHFAAIDLPGGQVAWMLDAEETTWLEGVPLYDKPFENATDEVMYQRVLAGL